MDRGAWQATIHGIAKSRTWLSHLAPHSISFLEDIQASAESYPSDNVMLFWCQEFDQIFQGLVQL